MLGCGLIMCLVTVFHLKKLIISENSSIIALFSFQTALIALIRNNKGEKNI